MGFRSYPIRIDTSIQNLRLFFDIAGLKNAHELIDTILMDIIAKSRLTLGKGIYDFINIWNEWIKSLWKWNEASFSNFCRDFSTYKWIIRGFYDKKNI